MDFPDSTRIGWDTMWFLDTECVKQKNIIFLNEGTNLIFVKR